MQLVNYDINSKYPCFIKTGNCNLILSGYSRFFGRNDIVYLKMGEHSVFVPHDNITNLPSELIREPAEYKCHLKIETTDDTGKVLMVSQSKDFEIIVE